MYLKDFMSDDRVFFALECASKPDLIKKMVDMVGESIPTLDKTAAFTRILEKEGLFSTGVGGGIAIPHAVIASLDKTCLAVATLKSPIDYRSVDNERVRVVFMLLSPEGKTQEHIRLLARIARICFNHHFVDQMKAAGGSKELYKIIVNEDDKHAE